MQNLARRESQRPRTHKFALFTGVVSGCLIGPFPPWTRAGAATPIRPTPPTIKILRLLTVGLAPPPLPFAAPPGPATAHHARGRTALSARSLVLARRLHHRGSAVLDLGGITSLSVLSLPCAPSTHFAIPAHPIFRATHHATPPLPPLPALTPPSSPQKPASPSFPPHATTHPPAGLAAPPPPKPNAVAAASRGSPPRLSQARSSPFLLGATFPQLVLSSLSVAR